MLPQRRRRMTGLVRSKATLLELSEEAMSLDQLLETVPPREIDEEAVSTRLASVEFSIRRKVDAYVELYDDEQARVEGLKTILERVKDALKGAEARADRLKRLARLVALKTGKAELFGELRSIKVSRSADSLEILKPEKVPERFKVKTLETTIPKGPLKEALVRDEATQAIIVKETGEELTGIVDLKPVYQVRFK